MVEQGVGTAEVVSEVRIAAGREAVWKALVEKTSRWWAKDFYTHPEPKAFVIEPRVGGRAYEDWGGGEGQVWYTVLGVRRGAMLRLAGEIFPQYGGPAYLQCTITLKDDGDGTALRLHEAILGREIEKMLSGSQQGWDFLLKCLKEFVEDGKRPEVPASVG